MKRFLFITLSLLIGTLGIFMLSACGDALEPVIENEGSAGGKYINIEISSQLSRNLRGTSTPPNGGEEGDGSELGFANEFTIDHVSVLLYKVPTNVTIPEGGLVNLSDEEAEKIKVYVFCWNTTRSVTNGGLNAEKVIYSTGSHALPKEMELGNYKILVVANKELTQLNGSSLNTVRKYILHEVPFHNATTSTGETIYNAPEKCSDFVMSSVKEQNIIIGYDPGHKGEGTENNPFVTTDGNIEIERLAARIDFAQKKEVAPDGTVLCKWNDTDKCYDYAVIDASTQQQVATFKLLFVIPFNMTRQCYLFKHTTTGTDLSSCNYLGRETHKTSTDATSDKRYATNYVLDPLTLIKGNKDAFYGEFFTPEFYLPSLANATLDFVKQFRVKSPDEMQQDAETGRYFKALTYTAENTLTVKAQQSTDPLITNYAPGIRFFGQYVKNGYTTQNSPYIALDWYLRHSAPDGTADLTQPMTYGVVRNNIYRVYISGIGKQNEQIQLKTRLFVVPWAAYRHDDIVM